MTRKCENCKWWGRPGKHGAPIVGFDPKGKKFCGRYVYGENSEQNDAHLDAGDDASSDGSLWTHPDFFCRSHEDK